LDQFGLLFSRPFCVLREKGLVVVLRGVDGSRIVEGSLIGVAAEGVKTLKRLFQAIAAAVSGVLRLVLLKGKKRACVLL
jgi:hypothetical protein